MEEIYYPDGSVGLVSEERIKELKENPQVNVVNPKERKATAKHNLLANIGGESVRIPVGLFKVQEKDIQAETTKIMRDPQGQRVWSREFIKSTGQLIDEAGRGRKYINENLQEIAGDDIRWFIETAEGEKEVVQFTKTEDIQIKEMPSGTEDSYVVKTSYEIVPDDENARIKLWKLVKQLKANNKIGVGLVVFKKGWEKQGILFVPYIDEKGGKFALIAKTTSKKFGLEQPQPIPVETREIPKGKELETGAEGLFK